MKTEHNPNLDEHFKTFKQDLPDEGFTKRVMHRIPEREPLISKKGFFISVIGVVLSLAAALSIQLFPSAPFEPDQFTLAFYLAISVGAVLVLIQALDPELDVM